MADFYLDHNVSAEIANVLRETDHTAVTADELGLDDITDDAHLLIAAERREIFVTHNRKDFELLHDAWRRWSRAWGVARSHAGILIVAQLDRSWWARVAAELAAFVESDPMLSNALYKWSPASGWRPRA